MTKELDCTQIGHQEGPNGEISSREFLFVRQDKGHKLVFSVVIADQQRADTKNTDGEVPPLRLPTDIYNDPTLVCKYLREAPMESLSPHLVPEMIPEDNDSNV